MSFTSFLSTRLTSRLPGIDAHREFVPVMQDAESRLKGAPQGARQSAVLVPLVYMQDEELPHVLLQVRSEGMKHHRGQISFPGGRIEDGEDASMAALREMHEEVGVRPDDVTLLGHLTPLYIPPSNSAVTPIVGVVRTLDDLHLSASEVQETFTLPLANIVSPVHIQRAAWELYGQSVDVPHWSVHERIPLWGATAMILNELVWLIREYLYVPEASE